MGRKKNYDREALVDAASELFHTHGFERTSTEMLVERLGVNRNSMYSEFGTKRALFDAVVERYDQRMVTSMLGALEAPGAGLDDIERLFEAFAVDATGRFAGMGCLMCNTAVELGGATADGEPLVHRYFDRLHDAFANALGHARDAGECADGVCVADEASFLSMAALGLFVMARANARPERVHAAVRSTRRHVTALRATRDARPPKGT